MKLPTYDSSSKALMDALNTMARAIEAVELRSTITSDGNIKCTQDSSGISLYHTDDHVYGSTNNPYVLGSTGQGSKEKGDSPSYYLSSAGRNVFGGKWVTSRPNADKPEPDPTVARQDTWIRTQSPYDDEDKPTDGVNFVYLRVRIAYDAYGVSKTYSFIRTGHYDLHGELWMVSKETLISDAFCSHSNPYVMRSRASGSLSPDSNAAASSLDQANTDTWDKYDPPQLVPHKDVSAITIGAIPEVTAAAHGITIGTKAVVKFSDTNSTPNINGFKIVTALTSNTVSVDTTTATTVAGSSGKMRKLHDGVTYDPAPRIYKASGVTKKFARQVKYDSCGELYYIGVEVEIEKCSSGYPYVMRSRLYGSTQPSNTTAALGLNQANQDTWDRFSPPLESGTTYTDGVIIGEVPRHYILQGYTSFTHKIFEREKKYDSCGELYFIGPEVLIIEMTLPGSTATRVVELHP